MTTAPSLANSATPPLLSGQSADTRRWIRIGDGALVGVVALFAALSLINISGAVVGYGLVGAESYNKTVQHLDGGIVAEILVRNGDRVAEGDVLLRLDPTIARANLAITQARIDEIDVHLARLEAERADQDSFALPSRLANPPANSELARTIATQRALFDARRNSRRGIRDGLQQRVGQLEQSIAGLESQLASRRRESELTTAELKVIEPLFERGYVSRQRVIPLHRDNARLDGEVGRLVAEIERLRSAVTEAKLKIITTDTDALQSIVDEMRKLQSARIELIESRTAQSERLQRIDVRAPRAGSVHALGVHTIGGVVPPGGAILQIVPEGDRLVIETRIALADADKIRIGQRALVRFPSFSSATTPRLTGEVTLVSPAQVTDNQGRSYFTAQVLIGEADIAKLPAGHKLSAGMPAEVFIETESRSILSYLVKPLQDALARTFRER